MPSTRFISKPSTRQAAVGMLAFLLTLITVLTLILPAAKAYAADAGGTTLGIIIIDSSNGQASPGTTNLGIRVTNSSVEFKTKYTLTLEHGNPMIVSAKKDVTYNMPLPDVSVPTWPGYTFLGYYDAAKDGNQIYDADGKSKLFWTKAENATLYAHWKGNEYTVSFDQMGGKGGQTTPVSATFKQPMPPVSTPTKEGYSFAGYFSQKSGGTQYYNVNGTSANDWSIANNTTLYAQWTPNTYQITWYYNDGTPPSILMGTTHGSTISKPTDPTRDGYVFAGWYTDENLTQKYEFSTPVTSSFRLYAKWNPTYTIVFNSNNGTGSMEPMSMVRGEAKALTANSFTRTGYKFTSWNTDPGGKGMTYTNQQSVDLTVNPGNTVTLYAQWDLVISCEFPTAGVLEIDASGKVTDVTTGGTNTFRSSTVASLVITEVESTKLEGANSLFANADTSGAKVVLTPPTGQGSVVEVPVANTKTSANFTIPAMQGSTQGQLALKFGLSLPPGMSLTYLPDQYRSIVQLSYAVSVAS